MSQTVVETVCFLCGAPAKYQETDAGNRRHYVCSGVPPGEYEISNRAMKELEQSQGLKARALAEAHRERDRDRIFEIIVSPTTQQLTFSVVKRRLTS